MKFKRLTATLLLLFGLASFAFGQGVLVLDQQKDDKSEKQKSEQRVTPKSPPPPITPLPKKQRKDI